MRTRAGVLSAFVFLLLCTVSLGQQSELRLLAKVEYAVAVAGLPQNGYYVLTADNVVYHYLASDSGLHFSGRFSLNSPGNAIDLTFFYLDQGASIVVTQWADKLRLGSVTRYSESGKVISSWKTQHIPAGVDFDPANHVLYFATADSHELYSVDLSGGEPRSVCEVRGARQLGPIALDVDQQSMYVADNQGGVFVVDLRSKRSRQLSSSFGLASALLLDSNRRVLYVADYVRRRINAVDTSTGSQSNRVITESSQLTGPSGLAFGPGDTLVVTDTKSGGVFLVPSGPSVLGTPQVAKPAKKVQKSRPQP